MAQENYIAEKTKNVKKIQLLSIYHIFNLIRNILEAQYVRSKGGLLLHNIIKTFSQSGDLCWRPMWKCPIWSVKCKFDIVVEIMDGLLQGTEDGDLLACYQCSVQNPECTTMDSLFGHSLL